MSESSPRGLDNKEWEGKPKENLPAIELLANREHHDRVLQYLKDRLEHSERKMHNFYARWRAQEKRVQGYLELQDYEQQLKSAADNKGTPDMPVSITVPYSYATISTIITYYIHTFTGRKPMFQIGTYNGESTESASNMEHLLQHNVDYKRSIRVIFRWLQDAEVYGVGVIRTLWTEDQRKVTRKSTILGQSTITREMQNVFQGNDSVAIDPFMFFPDPRVPMTEVAEKGEFVFWRSFEGRHILLKQQRDGKLHYVDRVGEIPAGNIGDNESARALRAGGESNPGNATATHDFRRSYVQLDQGSVEIIPEELGLGEGVYPEKWLFTIANKKQIIQAQPLDYDHDQHPVCVIEPHSLGHGFGNLGSADYLSPIQDAVSWFLNSHVHNVRAALNNMFVVNPAMVEMKDLTDPKPGKLIRLKRSAMGQDIRTIIHQLNVQDVTTGHIGNLETFLRIGDILSAVTDNLRGVQDAGGRKTATEVRTAGEAAASRLASGARLISAQGMCPWAMQMASNFQQNLTMEYALKVLGQEKMRRISGESIIGDFFFPIHDGTLPLDKVALLDTWKEIFLGMLQDPALRAAYDIPRIFEWIAELGGARNISSFKLNIAPDEMVAAQIAAGNGVPIGQS